MGVPWLGWTCGQCAYCQSGRENLCDQALFTGCHLDGGYAEYAVADQRFCFPIPQALSNTEAGAKWSGSSDQPPPHLLDASLIFAPVGALVPLALAATVKGGCVICAGIHMSDIPTFPYRLLWGERSVRSVANLTRDDGTAFFKELQHTPVHCDTTRFSLDDANQALALLRSGQFNGAIVLVP